MSITAVNDCEDTFLVSFKCTLHRNISDIHRLIMSNSENITNGAAGEPRTAKSKVLEAGASATQVVINGNR